MKLNNKGFAISTIMYMILILAIVLIVLTLAILSTRKLTLDKIKSEAIDNINGKYKITYAEALSIIKEEAISYVKLNTDENGNEVDFITIKTEDLDSEIEEEILAAYSLNERDITIEKADNAYHVYLEDQEL